MATTVPGATDDPAPPPPPGIVVGNSHNRSTPAPVVCQTRHVLTCYEFFYGTRTPAPVVV
ncbi:hypothetical protein Aglo01_08540 [Actinokineospora globicatena]|uniref:Uncharacterized protein n=1 Tax=Actinokineospora globicatena TaxID=103729 RepID=A0A9W6QUJ2_9PSEU|nr:hypothetical protein Aglo01_08540 [Actinokineospora globicatena]GLW94822.1 hypothetical protein Aglo03_56380 [Actinokineospora globicatena]